MKKVFLITVLITAHIIFSQESKRVLFIGNSYTGVNNLPQLTKDLSLSAGDTLIIDSHTPGGQTFQGHFSDATVNSKIAQGNWDFVVLQEQSQRPSFPDTQVEVEVFPFARKLDSLINLHNSCAETIFYMTWGRKNGDAGNCAFWPPVCTYSGMDSLLYLRYMQMAEDNQALVSPVGKLWNYLRINHPEIELYSADESHPSLAGSYAAACSFYTTIFRKNPILISDDYGLNPTDALAIRLATELMIFDSLGNWNIGKYDVNAEFTYTDLGNGQVQFSNISENADTYMWHFGDETFTADQNPTHEFLLNQSYLVELIAFDDCGASDTFALQLHLGSNELSEHNINGLTFYPNPVKDFLFCSQKSDFSYIIYDMDSRIIQSSCMNANSQIDLRNLTSGYYILQVCATNSSNLYFSVMKE